MELFDGFFFKTSRGIFSGLFGKKLNSEEEIFKDSDFFGDRKGKLGDSNEEGFGGRKRLSKNNFSNKLLEEQTEIKVIIGDNKKKRGVENSNKDFLGVEKLKQKQISKGGFGKREISNQKIYQGKGSSKRAPQLNIRGNSEKVIDVKELFSKLKGTEIGGILDFLKEEANFIKEKMLKLNFEGSKDFLSVLNKELEDFLMAGYEDLKQRISNLRKNGKRVNGLDIELMSAPLKIKIFSASGLKKDFIKVIQILNKINSGLNLLENKEVSEKEEKTKEKQSEK